MVLKVELENNVWAYYPGQTINGRVVVTKNIWHKVEGLSIRFLGKIDVGCPASAPVAPPRDAHPQACPQEGLLDRIIKSRPVQDVILDHKMNLLHSWKVLKPGSHEFPFTYELPDDVNLPESFRFDGFRIVYEFVVVLRRPRDDYKIYQTPFQVYNTMDQRCELIPFYTSPFESKTENTLGVWMCCKSGPYGMLFKVARRIISISDDANFVLEIWNETTRDLEPVNIQLIRRFKHKKGLETKKREIVSQFIGPSVPAGQREVWASYFRIPENTTPTNFVRRETYEITYALRALIQPLNQTNKSISIKCPLLVTRSMEMGTHFNAPEYSEQLDLTAKAMNPYHVPPPTYDETMGIEAETSSGVSGLPLLE